MASDLKITSFSDREILHLLNDLAGDEGWVAPVALAAQIGLARNGMNDKEWEAHASRCVGVRLAWIKRLCGAVERHEKKCRWRLTPLGDLIVAVKLSTALSSKVGSVDQVRAIELVGVITDTYTRSDAWCANLMRREWQYGTHANRKV